MKPYPWTAIMLAASLGLLAGLYADAALRAVEGGAEELPGRVLRQADVTLLGNYSDAKRMRWTCVEVPR